MRGRARAAVKGFASTTNNVTNNRAVVKGFASTTNNVTNNVGTRKLFENDDVALWEMVLYV
jgi:hypothetical protein